MVENHPHEFTKTRNYNEGNIPVVNGSVNTSVTVNLYTVMGQDPRNADRWVCNMQLRAASGRFVNSTPSGPIQYRADPSRELRTQVEGSISAAGR